MSIGKISAGSGVEYLTKQVASGADDYYAGHGERAGRWHGPEAAALGLTGEAATEHVEMLFGMAENPFTTEPLGSRFRHYEPMLDRVENRIAAEGAGPERAGEIRAEEARKGERTAVAGYDLTFSPPKSVSVLWGIADRNIADVIEAAHDRAIDRAFDMLEQEAAFTRTGRNGIRKEHVHGLIAVRYQHRDSRAKDPQLHTHCAVLNRVRTRSDGQWRAVDGQALYAASAWANAVYLSSLETELTEQLGVQWVAHKGAKASEIAGIDPEVIRLFSKRRTQIEEYFDNKPLTGTIGAVRAQWRKAVISTRAKKGAGVTTDALRERWANELTARTGHTPASVVRSATHQPATPTGVLDEHRLITKTLAALETSSSTWTYHRLLAELADQIPRLHHNTAEPETFNQPPPRYFTNADEQIETLHRIARTMAQTAMIRIDFDTTPTNIGTRNDGTGIYDTHTGGRRYTTGRILDAEQQLVDAATRPGGITINPQHIETVTNNRTLTDDQAAAVATVATSGRLIDVIVGPAGTGKTWTMGAIADMWRAAGHDIIGLALSQNAAEELAAATRARCENIARWRTMHEICKAPDTPVRQRIQWTMQPGDLIIVDEAGMAGTFDLHDLRQQAEQTGAKLLLVGDQHQLGSPATGGAFRLIVDDVGATQLTDVRRFQHQWERDASLALRDRNPHVITNYTLRNRLHGGTHDELVEQLVNDWHNDTRQGLDSVMIASTNDTAAILANRARQTLIADGHINPNNRTITLNDNNPATTGDIIRTRANDRQNRTGPNSFVKNRDRWIIEKVHRDGSLTVRRQHSTGRTRLAADYVQQAVELAYAGTAHAVQGATVDIGRTLADPDTSAETLYVAMTRGRNANHAYLVTKGFLSEHGGGNTTPEAVLATILTQPGNEPSATHQLRTNTTNTGTLHQLHAIRNDLADHEHTNAAIAAIDHAIQQRHQHLAHTTSINPPTWITNTIGTPTPTNHHQWATTAHALAQYQDRWAPGHPQPLQTSTPHAAKHDRQKLLQHIHQLNTLGQTGTPANYAPTGPKTGRDFDLMR